MGEITKDDIIHMMGVFEERTNTIIKQIDALSNDVKQIVSSGCSVGKRHNEELTTVKDEVKTLKNVVLNSRTQSRRNTFFRIILPTGALAMLVREAINYVTDLFKR